MSDLLRSIERTGDLQASNRLDSRELEVPSVPTASIEEQSNKSTFADLLQDKLQESNSLIQEANHFAEELIAGRNKDIQGVMVALEKADVSFRMLMQVRNKLLDAYREIMKMQI